MPGCLLFPSSAIPLPRWTFVERKIVWWKQKEETITIHGEIKREHFFLSLTTHHSKRPKGNDSYRIAVQKSLRSSSDRKLFHRSFILFHRLIFFTGLLDGWSPCAVYEDYRRVTTVLMLRGISYRFSYRARYETNPVCYSLNGNKAFACGINKGYVCNSRQTNLYSTGEVIGCY